MDIHFFRWQCEKIFTDAHGNHVASYTEDIQNQGCVVIIIWSGNPITFEQLTKLSKLLGTSKIEIATQRVIGRNNAERHHIKITATDLGFVPAMEMARDQSWENRQKQILAIACMLYALPFFDGLATGVITGPQVRPDEIGRFYFMVNEWEICFERTSIGIVCQYRKNIMAEWRERRLTSVEADDLYEMIRNYREEALLQS